MRAINIEQKTNVEESLVVGRNGTIILAGLKIWSNPFGNHVYFDCLNRQGRVLNAGFSVDRESFVELCGKMVNLVVDGTKGDPVIGGL